MSRLEQWIDRITPARENEVELTDEARRRVFSKRQGSVPVPESEIRLLSSKNGGLPRYSMENFDVPYNLVEGGEAPPVPKKIVDENRVTAGLTVADQSILGPHVKYDDTFKLIMSDGAQERVDRIRKKVARSQLAASVGLVIGLAFIAAATDAPVMPEFVGANNCERDTQGLDADSYLSVDNVTNKSDIPTCTVSGQTYYIIPRSERAAN